MLRVASERETGSLIGANLLRREGRCLERFYEALTGWWMKFVMDGDWMEGIVDALIYSIVYSLLEGIVG